MVIEACDWCKLPAHIARSFRTWGTTLRRVRLRGDVWRRDIDDEAEAVIGSPLCLTELRER